jgi:TetR/AcrR family transcriptional regulator, regulator of biofilm formation and stress response
MGVTGRVDWLDTDSLLAAAREAGGEVTDRQLELWRYKGLMPRPVRAEGQGRWLYPPGADRRLARLVALRASIRSLELIRVVLWLDGFAVELGEVRKALADGVRRPAEAAELREGEDTIEGLAAALAASRGRALLAGGGMSREERTRAYALLLAAAFGDPAELAARGDDEPLLARLFGGEGSAAAALATGGAPALPLPRPAELPALVEAASDAELELARRVVRASTVWWPLMVSLAGRDRPDGAALSALARETAEGLPADLLPLLVAGVLGALRSEPAPADLPPASPPPRGEVRRAILEAGVTVVARHGFDGLTYRAVAQQAGTTHGAVGYHFKTREKLIHEVALEARRLAVAGSSIVPADGDLDSFGADLADSADADLDAHLFQYELSLQARRRPGLAREMRSLYEGYYDLTRQALEKVGIADPDEDLVRFVFAAIDGLVIRQIVDDDPAATDGAVAELRRMLSAMGAGDGR